MLPELERCSTVSIPCMRFWAQRIRPKLHLEGQLVHHHVTRQQLENSDQVVLKASWIETRLDSHTGTERPVIFKSFKTSFASRVAKTDRLFMWVSVPNGMDTASD